MKRRGGREVRGKERKEEERIGWNRKEGRKKGKERKGGSYNDRIRGIGREERKDGKDRKEERKGGRMQIRLQEVLQPESGLLADQSAVGEAKVRREGGRERRKEEE